MEQPSTPIDRWALRLALVAGVGPRTRQALLEEFATPQAVFESSPARLLRVRGVGRELSNRIHAARDEALEESVLATCQTHQIQILLDDDPVYPDMLRHIPDPPPVLFVSGELHPRDSRCVAIVGTRHATPYGIRQADRFARQLVAVGMTVVSGLARGIDAAAHRGALAAGGRTLAVLGGGRLRLYPPEHEVLARQIEQSGAVLSELPPEQPPSSGNFPQRNRVISGLSMGVIVVEAGERSGALISARHALEQGREVFAVPGPIDSSASRGCHQLLRDGAKLVESVEDVLEELDSLLLAAQPIPTSGGNTSQIEGSPIQLSDDEVRVWQALGSEAALIDDVLVASGLPASRALAILGSFEVRHLVRRIGGAKIERRKGLPSRSSGHPPSGEP